MLLSVLDKLCSTISYSEHSTYPAVDKLRCLWCCCHFTRVKDRHSELIYAQFVRVVCCCFSRGPDAEFILAVLDNRLSYFFCADHVVQVSSRKNSRKAFLFSVPMTQNSGLRIVNCDGKWHFLLILYTMLYRWKRFFFFAHGTTPYIRTAGVASERGRARSLIQVHLWRVVLFP